jgi:hypothetical protein
MTWTSFLNCRKMGTALLSFPYAQIGIPTRGTKVPARPEWIHDEAQMTGPTVLAALRTGYWVKVKNRKHPAMERVMDTFS